MALGGIPDPATTVVLDIPETLPMVAVDKGLLERSVGRAVPPPRSAEVTQQAGNSVCVLLPRYAQCLYDW
ncbi:hypothetical protein ACFWBS_42985 [Streptomyces mirabilis]|uniref:hypothetical protein n=1 Tax=Streptomyces TaxID=1883 RepID=UPI000BE435F1|nr:hypothetical protein [Streptomyces sp. OK228]